MALNFVMGILLRFKNIILCLGLLLLLSACDGDETWCLGSDENTYSDESVITNQSSLTSVVNADGSDPKYPGTLGRWVYSGTYVTKGDKISIYAVGDIITAMPYGLTEGSNPSSDYNNADNTGAGTDGGSSSSEYQNNGKGIEFVINANSNSPTLITGSDGKAYNFTANQYITVTTAGCKSYTNSKPTKWTWANGWNQQAVRCKYIKTYKKSDNKNYTPDAPVCKAMRGCSSDGVYNQEFPTWGCSHDTISTNSYTSEPSLDTCPSNDGGAEDNSLYICENNTSAEDGCYTATDPPYVRQGDWCDGSRQDQGVVTVSRSSPPCSSASSKHNTDEVAIPNHQYNACGTTDTCWNTGGYRLYAVQTGVQCPNDEQCIHLNKSTEGKGFSSVGGALYLQIIDPNNQGTAAQTSDEVKAKQDQIATNNQTITQLEAQIEALELTLMTQLNTVNDYSPEMKTLENQALTLGAGINATNQTAKDQLLAMQLLFNDQTESVSDIEETFVTYSTQINSTTQAEGETSTPWQATLVTMNSQANGIITSAQGLTTTIEPTTPPDASATTTTDQMVNYKNNVVKMLSDLNVAIVIVQTTQSSIDDLNQQIADLESQNETLEQEILATNNVTYEGLTGGYTVYVKADPFKASNGKYLKAIISNEDPNMVGAEYYILSENITNQDTPHYEITTSGNVWLKIFDPDDNYSNNMDSYSVTISKLTTSGTFGAMFTDLIAKIKSGVSATAEKIFNGIACTDRDKTGSCHEYITAINAMLVLYMAVFGMMFLFGLIQTDHVDFVMRAVKIAIVIILIRADSFTFFSTYLFQGFMGFSDTLIANATGAPYSNPFDFLNQSISVMLFDSNTYFKIIGLLFQGTLGIVVFILLIYACVAFTMAIFSSFMIYMMSFIGLAMCFAVAPIFISFLLFKQTEHLFESWFKTMVRFVVQPVVLIIGLIVLNGMLTSLLEEMFNFKVCFKCTLPYNFVIPGFPEVGTATMFCVPWFAPWGEDNVGSGGGLIISMPLAITFAMVTTLMRSYAKGIATEITQSIVGGMTMFSSGGGSARPLGPNPFGDLYESSKKLVGMGDRDVARRKNVREFKRKQQESLGLGNNRNSSKPKGRDDTRRKPVAPTLPPTT